MSGLFTAETLTKDIYQVLFTINNEELRPSKDTYHLNSILDGANQHRFGLWSGEVLPDMQVKGCTDTTCTVKNGFYIFFDATYVAVK